jgi:hypothetical protein
MDQDDVVLAPWTTVKFRINGAKLAFADLNAALNPVASANQVNTLNNQYLPAVQLYLQRTAAQIADQPQPVKFIDLDDIYLSVESAEDIPRTSTKSLSYLGGAMLCGRSNPMISRSATGRKCQSL